MPYADQNAIQMAAGGADRLRELADWDGDGNIDAAVIAQAQTSADAWIDAYVRLRFATPIASPSPTIVRIAAEEAVYWLRSSRGALGMTELDVMMRKDRARELEQIRDGKLRPDEPLPARSTAVRSAIVELGGHVTRDGTKGMW